MKSVAAASIDEYLNALPEKERMALEKLRKTIRSVAPDAEEVISYQIPTFKYNGALVGFASFKEHLGFYVMSHAVMKAFSDELKPYDTATATIRFSADKPLPVALVKKIVGARMYENETIAAARNERKQSMKKSVS